ncbi:histidine phosphatase family protein [Kineosporia sp. A_224]|uniref:histidine phosphatase family protein n=1 Tax=Kineosporia sp. A_224 TaxID=1962180 RepID=UPI000B4BE130|nr:histidine phosphatase family protein [Kineosporia sp. A_224]
MAVEVVFETHAWSVDNERGVATGWLPGELSARGRDLARELGARRRDDGISTVLCSDLRRARQTVEIAFEGADVPVLFDTRLRECDYGDLNGAPVAVVHADRAAHLHAPFPAGESWAAALDRVDGALDEIAVRWAGQRVLVVGHVATRWALDRRVLGASLDTLSSSDFGWREGWEYLLV